MRQIKFYLSLIPLILCVKLVPAANFPTILKIVKPRHAQLDSILADLYKQNESNFKWHKMAYVIIIEQKATHYLFQITIYYKEDVRWIYDSQKNKPIRFMYFNDIPVVIFGNNYNRFFKSTDDIEMLSWFKFKPLSKDIIDCPPAIDLWWWLYTFQQGKFTFKEAVW